MTEYETFSGPKESPRAPEGICEINVQIITHRAMEMQAEFERLVHKHLNQNYDTRSFDMETNGGTKRLVVDTGTDRLGIDELRDIAELYARAIGYSRGNIPPNMSIYPATSGTTEENVRVWLEIKLQREMPMKEVINAVESEIGVPELTPRHPEGTSMRAMKFREENYAFQQVRSIVEKSNAYLDNLPVDYIQLVCEA